jgi:hypothetical protein
MIGKKQLCCTVPENWVKTRRWNLNHILHNVKVVKHFLNSIKMIGNHNSQLMRLEPLRLEKSIREIKRVCESK